jgi:hypothetical protein
MDKQDLERRLEAAEKQNLGLLDEIKNLKEKLAEKQDEPEIPDFPEFKYMRNVYQMDHEFDVMVETYGCYEGDGDFTVDGARLYNNFHNKEMAQEFAKKCKLIAMMLHCKWYLDRDYVPKWDDSPSFCVYFSHLFNKFMVYKVRRHEDVTVYFSTEENAMKCAEWLNEHWRENDE